MNQQELSEVSKVYKYIKNAQNLIGPITYLTNSDIENRDKAEW